jgi:hypothetical protein
VTLRRDAWIGTGIALSVIWIFAGAGYWTSMVNENAWADAEETFLVCRDGQPRDENFDACLAAMQDDYDANADSQPRWEPLIARALIPIPPAWAAAYGLIALYRRKKRTPVPQR